MSGTTTIPRFARTSSATGVVGPLAASATSLARMREALRRGIWFSSAARTSTSQSSSSRSSLLTLSVPLRPTTLPVFALCARTFSTSRPLAERMPPAESLPAPLRAPLDARDQAAPDRLLDADQRPAGGGRGAAIGAANRERLAGHHRQIVLALVGHVEGVEDPGHRG